MTDPQELIGRIWQGDCMEWLGMLPDNSAHCCITSIPYWGLRDYQTPAVVWGGDAECEHEWGDVVIAPRHNDDGIAGSTLGGGKATQGQSQRTPTTHAFCSLCGAWRGDLGLEPTPELYVEHVVMIFREVRRVLREDAVCFLNMGDSYNGSGGAGGDYNKGGLKEGQPRFPGRQIAALKPKDLCGIPWRVAFALQAPWLRCKGCGQEAHALQWATFPNGRRICPACEKSRGAEVSEQGWWLRSDVIWRKPNPMPESVTDRPTRSHEYVFLFSKAARYWYDADAVREAIAASSIQRIQQPTFHQQAGGHKDYRHGTNENRSARLALEHFAENTDGGRNLRSVWTIATESMGWEMCTACKRVYDAAQYRRLPQVLWLRVLGAEADLLNELRVEAVGPIEMLGRNTVRAECECGEGVAVCRTGEEALPCTACDLQYQLVAKGICSCGRDDSWLSHFATFPTKLVARCLEAGCPHKVCAECGAPSVREVERSESDWATRKAAGATGGSMLAGHNTTHGARTDHTLGRRDVRMLGFLPTCSCGGETEPGLLIDPFAGSGTALVMAERLQRRHAGCDLNSDYVKMAEERIKREQEQKQLALEH